jgi:hypothetical protein
MPRAGKPLNEQTVREIWEGVLLFPAGLSFFVVVTFAPGEHNGPAWHLWAMRAGVALFCWRLGQWLVAPSFRELRRRNCWLPRVAAWPGLFTAGMILVSGVGWVLAVSLIWLALHLCGLFGA